MFTIKVLNTFLSGLLKNKQKGVYYKEVYKNCYLLVKPYKKKDFSYWNDDYSVCKTKEGFNFYDIRFSVVLTNGEELNCEDFQLNYSLCKFCEKQELSWVSENGKASDELAEEIKTEFYHKIFEPLFTEKKDLYMWVKSVTEIIFKNKPMLLDELYFMFDLAEYTEKQDEARHWKEKIEACYKKAGETVPFPLGLPT